MTRKNATWALLGLCGSLLVAAAPAAPQAAQPVAQHASVPDIRVVCHNVKQAGSHARERLCATPSQWHAFRDMKLVCRSHKPPGAEGKSNALLIIQGDKQQYCATVAQWRVRASRPASWFSSEMYSPSVPGNTNFGTVANQSDFQR